MSIPAKHDIPLFTLVEVDCIGINEHGLRLYVQGYSRDCDGTPLYDLTHDATMVGKNIDEKPASTHPMEQYGHIMDKGKVTRHFSAECLTIIESAESVMARLSL